MGESVTLGFKLFCFYNFFSLRDSLKNNQTLNKVTVITTCALVILQRVTGIVTCATIILQRVTVIVTCTPVILQRVTVITTCIPVTVVEARFSVVLVVLVAMVHHNIRVWAEVVHRLRFMCVYCLLSACMCLCILAEVTSFRIGVCPLTQWLFL